MKAVVYRGINDLRLEDIPKPHIESPTDALIRVTTSAICASDIHIINEGGQEPGKTIGHEYCGVIIDSGDQVRHFKKGDRVVGQPFFNCGYCLFCQQRQQTLCENGGLLGAFGNQGVQAEYARIPLADNTLRKIPDGLPDEKVIFTGDILSTGLTGVLRAHVGLGDTVAVFGSGPVGLCAVACAHLFGASLIIAIDIQDYRLDVARRLGAMTINAAKEDPVAKVRELTGGRGVDAGIEAAGFESTIRTCLKSTRRGGRVSILGSVTQPTPFDLSERFFDMFTLTIGLGDLNHMEELIRLIHGGQLDLRLLITHTLPLSEALRGYEIFDKKLEGCIKVILKHEGPESP